MARKKLILIIIGVIVLFYIIWALLPLPICPFFSPVNPTTFVSCTFIEFTDTLYRALFGFRGLLT